MRKIIILFISIWMVSCGEPFEELNAEEINKEIAERDNIKTIEELIIIFYNYQPDSGSKPKFQITKKELGDSLFEATLICEDLVEDSQKGEKIIMTARKTGNKWFVKKILYNWKCYAGSGHTDWGVESCDCN
jgi:hypothetical protein